MNTKFAVLVAMSVAFLSACASNGQVADTQAVDAKVVEGGADRSADAADASKDDVICTRRHKVGTNFYRTVCTTREEREAARSDAEDAMRLQQQRDAANRVRPGQNF